MPCNWLQHDENLVDPFHVVILHATSDRGIVMLRRLLEQQLRTVAAGGDPAGVSFDPDAPPMHFSAGNFLAGVPDHRDVFLTGE